ncbi:HMG domain-containing protein 3-like [Dendronephthya gigantea]|uniref:HMG domain-containing protein 3-like n=1 Tax=Dendronephthya gigantea TaxID=151771 RepID=UPI00106C8908|nr:HMG domain-containing protein 3-like [Dendronephthya gigantea]
MSCTGKDCRGYMAKGKHKKVKCNCIHLHMYCLAQQSKETEPSSLPDNPTEEEQLPDINSKASARDYTVDIALARQLPYKFEKTTIETILEHDVNTWKGISDGWPEVFVPCCSDCQKCGSPLSPPKSHPGKKGNCYLITDLNPFKLISIKVKMCSNSACQAMHQAVPFDIGLFNISDKLMVSFDILLEIREYFKTGHPLTNVIRAKLAMMQIKSKEVISYVQYIEDLIYNGYLMFEAITERDLNDVICGICGICPEVCLGDGNEKNCCSNAEVALIGDIYSLYCSIMVGLSPCHTFSKVPGKTGGFYHFVCRHGCTVASKFLALTESVRDAADIYLSLKYPPMVFINDTPCGFVRHLECRAPNVSKELWGERSGCFEKPILGKEPKDNHNVPSIVPPEYKASTDTTESNDRTVGRCHPLSGCSERYVLGDRFHASSNPHKSPLCQYHDINLCAQANSITTSVQECQNNSKNARRLRSSCQQNFGTHIFFNYLMDYYQNEEIVKRQQINLSIGKKDNEVLVRDELLRFKLKER